MYHVKSTTLLIAGRKTNYTGKKLLKALRANEFQFLSERRPTAMTSFGQVVFSYNLDRDGGIQMKFIDRNMESFNKLIVVSE